jgi:predicted Rossmann fold nucleotide-binding protein DprA/Smf involved in DNA uptake
MVHDRPPLLFIAVAPILGRAAGRHGRDTARYGYVIVSGLAGIGTVAHSTAIELGARTLAVIVTWAAARVPEGERGVAGGRPSRSKTVSRNATFAGLTLP